MSRIGIDVGGTNTDAVMLDGAAVLGAVKTPTTEDVTLGTDCRSGFTVRYAGQSG